MEWLLGAVPARLFHVAFLGLFATLASVVLYRVMQGALEAPGMLSASGSGPAEGERAVMMLATVAAAAAYCHQCLAIRPWISDALPEPHEWIVWVAAGGQGSYLLGKFLRLSGGRDS
jgi:hypothetical protein